MVYNYNVISTISRRFAYDERGIIMKVTFMGAGSTVFSKNVLGDTMLCDAFHDVEIAL